MLVAAPIVFLVLLFIAAPYGRHSAEGWGPAVPARHAWRLMEAPASLLMLVVFLLVPVNLVVYLCLILWQVHYFYRAFIYPLTLKSARMMPVLVVVMGVVFNLANAFIQGYHFVRHADWYDLHWFTAPNFLLGVSMFFAGLLITRRSDAILASLRTSSTRHYGVPRGFLYRWVSCPNYLGESIQWLGWALMTLSPAAWVFLLWTLANLVPRAISHHRWYQQTFADYPPDRKAILPFVL